MTDAEPYADTQRDRVAGVTVRETQGLREPVARMADAVRALAFDECEGRPAAGLAFALGMADAATQLATHAVKLDAADPRWPDRDRCVVSAGAGATLLRALRRLTGHEGADADPPRGPEGHDLATAAGLALAERMLAARFGKSLVDHRTWALLPESELRAGLGHDAVRLAGQLRLEKLTVLFEDAGGDEDRLRCLAAHGWAVKQVDAGDPAALSAALSAALRSKKPSAIACRPRPRPASRAELGWPEPACGVPGPLSRRWQEAGGRGAAARRAWIKRLARHPLRAEFERVAAGRLPEGWREAAASMRAGDLADAPGAAVPELVGDVPGAPPSRCVPPCVRTLAAAGLMNGVASHGGLIPCAAGPLAGSDPLRASLRLAARLKLRAIHVLTEGGDDGSADQLAGLRAIAGVAVFRPADAAELAECWDLALRRVEGPSVIVRPDGALPRGGASEPAGGAARGGYVAAEAGGPRRATLVASGTELRVAAEARELLAGRGIATALVSLPCWELFAAQDESYRCRVLGAAPRFGIEAGCGFGWERWLGPDGVFAGSVSSYDHRRSSAITAEIVSAVVVKRLGS